MRNKKILLSAVIVTVLLSVTVMAPASASGNNTVGNDTLYWRNLTPQNDVLEFTAYPGDVLIQGRNYDLKKVYGSSGLFAHWNNSFVQGTDCNPDLIENISYIGTNGKINPAHVYLDWVPGDWLQWDGCFDQYIAGQTAPNLVPYTNDNNLMFRIDTPQSDGF